VQVVKHWGAAAPVLLMREGTAESTSGAHEREGEQQPAPRSTHHRTPFEGVRRVSRGATLQHFRDQSWFSLICAGTERRRTPGCFSSMHIGANPNAWPCRPFWQAHATLLWLSSPTDVNLVFGRETRVSTRFGDLHHESTEVWRIGDRWNVVSPGRVGRASLRSRRCSAHL